MTADDLPSAGTYLLQVCLHGPRCLRIGCLGAAQFPAGGYLHVGTAKRALVARLVRHAARGKFPHWHIDYLTEAGEVRGAWIWVPGRECTLATALADLSQAQLVLRKFGSSDCQCPAHLFFCTGSLPGILHCLQQQVAGYVTELTQEGIIDLTRAEQ